MKLFSIKLSGPDYCPPNFSIEDFRIEPEHTGYVRRNRIEMDRGVAFVVLGPDDPNYVAFESEPFDEREYKYDLDKYDPNYEPVQAEDEDPYEDEGPYEYEYEYEGEEDAGSNILASYVSARSCFEEGNYQSTLNLLEGCDEELDKLRCVPEDNMWGFTHEFVDSVHPYNKSILNGILGHIEETDKYLLSLPGHWLGKAIDDCFKDASVISDKQDFEIEIGDQRLIYDVFRYSNYATLYFQLVQEIGDGNPKLQKFAGEARDGFESLYRNVRNYPRPTESFKKDAAIVSFNLACLLLVGSIDSNKPDRARKLFHEISDHYPKAKFNLGVMQYLGLGAPRDYVAAATMFYEAGLEGICLSSDVLGFIKEYLPSTVIRLDEKVAKSDELIIVEREIRRKQIEEESTHFAEAKRNQLKLILPTARFLRAGVDYQQLSYSLVRRSDKLGESAKKSDVCFQLGFLSAYGLGVRRDVRNAIKYYSHAAKYGEKKALFNLGCIIQHRVRNPDLLKAYAYFSLAEAANVGGARERTEELEKDMAKNEILEAQKITKQLESEF